MRQHLRLIALSFSLSVLAGSAYAIPPLSSDPLIEGAKLCTKAIQTYEKQNRIPTHLLSAIASTESGRWNDRLKIVLPWPWTINANGKGYYLNSKQEAIATARKLQLSGIQSMDVGCMQVNLMHHPHAFRSLDEAFEPQNNVAYASQFLTELYASEGTWKKAAAAYHSKTPILGSQYVGQVYDKWYTIVDRLKLARSVIAAADIPGPGGYVARNKNSGPLVITPTRQVNYSEPAKQTVLGEQAGRALNTQQPVHMKVISVAGASAPAKREKGVLVVRPETQAQAPAASAAITPDEIAALGGAPKGDMKVAEAAAPSAGDPQESHIIRIASPKPTPGKTTARTSGPRFIFDE